MKAISEKTAILLFGEESRLDILFSHIPSVIELLDQLPLYVEVIKTESGELIAHNVHLEIMSAWFKHLCQDGTHIIKTRTDILNNLIQRFNLNSYLEIGVRGEENFRRINCLDKTGVDPSLSYHGNNLPCTIPAAIENPDVVYATSDSFFSTLPLEKKYDLIFIDGLHLEHQVDKDLQNSLNHLSDRGFILMHDCNPPTVYHAREDVNDLSTPAKGKWNGTTWKSFVRARCTNKDIFACVIDLDWGCGLIHKMSKQELYNVDDVETCLQYEYMHKNREQLLNLISVDDFLIMDIGKK